MPFSFSLLFLLFYTVAAKIEPLQTTRRPNIYRWLAQNSYICDPTLLNKRSHRFLTQRESGRLRCSCGDPLITKAACATRSLAEKPKCFRLPDACLQEYFVIFAAGGNRLSKPLPRRLEIKTTIVRRPSPKRRPKIVSTQPVNTVLRVRKLQQKKKKTRKPKTL